MVDKLLECIADKRIAIIGAGGLGGNIISFTARLNPKEILICDGDVFCPGNMNRQLFCSDLTMGLSKAECARDVVQHYTTAKLTVVKERLTRANSFILKEFDVIIDATDNIETRFLLQDIGEEYNIPVIHGAINGLFGQMAVIRPKSKLLSRLNDSGQTPPPGPTLSYVPAHIATLEVSEMVKVLAGVSTLNDDEIIIVDLLTNDTRILRI
ncbi:MAG TPA: ThiF family adenylyltransferase [Clostridia bacterium]|jgi:molybdopterin/thiamine biosynthesis adenylyltransferase|nr:ThiF family adenylyltransferase [Clostridia bacterium]